MVKQRPNLPFSKELEEWRTSSRPKTIGAMNQTFGEKSFAIIFLVLMSIPALPIPTGGITHVFEVIVVIIALQMLVGRRTFWLPRFAMDKKLPLSIVEKGLPFLIRKIRWLEGFSRPRLSNVLDSTISRILSAAIIIVFTMAAMLAPPFSFLDTLPALGVVIIALALILEDVILLFVGTAIGLIGVVVMVTLGKVVTAFVKGLF